MSASLQTLTPEQHAIIDAVTNTRSNLLFRARAGSGKTFMILESTKALLTQNPSLEISIAAFNKAIQLEISHKLQHAGLTDWRTCQAVTLHSLGFGLLKYAYKPAIDDKKVLKLIDTYAQGNGPLPVEPWVFRQYSSAIAKLVRVAKQAAVGFFEDSAIDNVQVWAALAEHYDIDEWEETSDLDLAIKAARYVYKTSLNDTTTIDFDDMILFPLIKNLRVRFQKDVLFVDEAQDLSRARQALARKFVKFRGRMIIVGDDRQAIYGFSGADTEGLLNFQRSLNATTLPLSTCWRCATAVVAEAQRVVPDIYAAPGAPQGTVQKVTVLPATLGPSDAILCRNTAPLIELAYSLIRQQIPCHVEGRDIGEGIKALLTRWKVKTLDAFESRLTLYRDREVQKYQAKGNDSKVASIEDRCDTVIAITNECRKQNLHNVQDAVNFVDALFADGDTHTLTLCTYHRSKGREWPTVVLLEHAQRCPSRYARQPWQRVQEDNLAYVAITRAQFNLYYLN